MAFPKPFYRWRPHPWHGLDIGPQAPRVVHAYIEITPFDLIKYEVDKATGYLRVDRPQRGSSQPPTLERLRHYFSTYKMVPGRPTTLTVERSYGRDHALDVVRAAIEDYREELESDGGPGAAGSRPGG